ncbi:MAG: hypothetical protein WC822_06925 [Candidatus Paceibacterota bacterium]|jgi:hypothetical protein
MSEDSQYLLRRVVDEVVASNQPNGTEDLYEYQRRVMAEQFPRVEMGSFNQEVIFNRIMEIADLRTDWFKDE